MKPQRVYLDTNAFRYFGTAFSNATLPTKLRDRILISPLSAFEVLAQLADEASSESVLRQVHAIRNWTNPQRTGLLPWPDDILKQFWFKTVIEDDGFTKQMQDSLNVCLTATSATEIKEAALAQKQVMDDFKLTAAQAFKSMVDDLRAQQGALAAKPAQYVDTTMAWFQGIARRIGADPNSKTVSEIQTLLSAYHEFEQRKLRSALVSPEYNPLSKKNRNDVIDAEQLVYLGDNSLCLLTADKAFKNKVTQSEQAARVVYVPAVELMQAQRAEDILRNELSP